MKNKALSILLFVAFAQAQNFQVAEPGYGYQFPRDHFSHPQYQTEWWYYTGNLRADDGHRYGFELTFFRQAQTLNQAARDVPPVWRADQMYLAHLALSDIDRGDFYHTERLHRAGPGLAGASLEEQRYWNGNWQVRWTSLTEAKQELTAITDRFSLRLDLIPGKPPIIQGEDGISRKGPLPSQASHYISFTRLQAKGELTQASRTQHVIGTAWMDHEFFTEPPQSDLSGWDWFAIQLADNEELMLYQLRNRDGKSNGYSSGSFVDTQGKMHFLSPHDFSLVAGNVWQSKQSGARYPVEWRIQVPSLGLTLEETTDLKNQELYDASGVSTTYWEGAVKYQGTRKGKPVSGVGYLEMTGYAQPVRLNGVAGENSARW